MPKIVILLAITTQGKTSTQHTTAMMSYKNIFGKGEKCDSIGIFVFWGGYFFLILFLFCYVLFSPPAQVWGEKRAGALRRDLTSSAC